MVKTFDFTLKESSSMLVCGPTMSGKSTFVRALLNDVDIFGFKPNMIYWYFGQAIANVADVKPPDNYIYENGLPDTFDHVLPNSIIVLDDLMSEAKDHAGVTALFTKLVHHKKLFVINITQNFFYDSKETRTRRLNTQYIVLFKNPSDVTQVHIIGRQMYPSRPMFLACVNAAVTKDPHSYLFIDLRQETPDDLRIRSRILRHEFPMFIYKPPP